MSAAHGPPRTVDQAWTHFVRNWRIGMWPIELGLTGPSGWRTCCEDEEPCVYCDRLLERQRQWQSGVRGGALAPVLGHDR